METEVHQPFSNIELGNTIFFIESAAIPDHFMPYASLFAFEQNFKAELFK